MIDYPKAGSFTENTALPVLRHHGITSLDALIITETEYTEESINLLLEEFPVKELYLPEEADPDLIKKDFTEIKFIKEGSNLSFGEINISSLIISEGICSLSVSNSGSTLLIPGNIEAKAEALLSEKATDVDFLKAPRHGNKGSLSEALLEKTTPEAVIVSTGRKLSDDFSKRLEKFDIYTTKVNGDITVNCKTKEINPYKKVK